MIKDAWRTRLLAFKGYVEPSAFLLLALAQGLLVLVAERPPFRDAPLYEVTFFLLGQEAGTRTWFTIDLLGSHGSLVFALGRELSQWFAPQTAYQLLMAASVCMLPLSFRALCRALGRGALVSWSALPLALHAGVFLGDLRLAISLPLALLYVTCTVSLMRSRSWLSEVLLVLLSSTLFFCHSGLWALSFGMGWLSLLFPSDIALLVRARSSLISGLLVVAACLMLDLSWLSTFDDDFRFLFADCEPSARLSDFSLFMTYTLREDGADRLTRTWAVLIALSVALGLTHSAELSANGRRLRLYAAAAAGLSLLAFVLTPADFELTWGWGLAWAGLCVLLLLSGLPLPTGRARAALLACFALTAVWRAVQVSHAFDGFRREEVSDFAQVLERVPTRRHLLVLIADPHSKFLYAPVLQSYGAFYQALSPDGLAAPVMSDLPGWPIALRDNAPRPPLSEQSTLFATGYVYPATLDWADYVLTRGVWVSRPEDRTKLVYEGSAWNLYRVTPAEESIRGPRGPSRAPR